MKEDQRANLRLTNRKLVLQQLFNNAPTSRAEIAQRLGLNKSTVSSLYNELKAEGYIKKLGIGESTSNGGRRPHLIRLNRDYGFVASFEIGSTHLRAMFNYLDGEIISFREFEMKQRDVLTAMQQITAEIDQMIKHNTTVHGLLAIGFSIHGIVSKNQVTDSPFLELSGIDLKTYYEDKYGIPVVLGNEANLSAVFERDFGETTQFNNLIAISIHRGIGAGIITNRRLYAGNEGLAGEIGRSLIVKDNGNLTKVENVCSEAAIFSRIQKVKHLQKIKMDQVAELYESNDNETVKIINEMVEQLGKVTFNAITSFGPQAVYFNAPIMEAIPEIYPGVKEWLAKVKIPSQVTIRLIQGSKMASLLGASSAAIHTVLEMEAYDLTLKWPKEVKNLI